MMNRRKFLFGLIATPLAAALAKVPLPQSPRYLDYTFLTDQTEDAGIPRPITWWRPSTAYEKGDIVVWTDGTLKQCFMGGDVNSTLRGPRWKDLRWKDLPPTFPIKFKTARARASFRRIKPEDSVL